MSFLINTAGVIASFGILAIIFKVDRKALLPGAIIAVLIGIATALIIAVAQAALGK